MAAEILEIVATVCGRCAKPVEATAATPIPDPHDMSVIVGHKLTYSCHGETKSFDVAKWWFEDPANKGLPFVPKVFSPVVEIAPAPDGMTIDDIASILPPGYSVQISITSGAVDTKLFQDGKELGFEVKTIGYGTLQGQAFGTARDAVKRFRK